MVYLFIRQTIGDYRQWKEGFDTHTAARQAGGATAEVFLMRNIDVPQEIILLLGWRDIAQARRYIGSVSWQVAMRQMGVIDIPEVKFLDKV